MGSSLEKLCTEHGLSFDSDSSGVRVIASHHYPEAPHSIKISPTSNGRLGILVEFPICAAKEIQDVNDFCSEVQKILVSGASIAFDEKDGNFFMYDVIDTDDLREYIGKLSHDCDIINPLFESVGRHGYCHYQGIWLARRLPSELGRYTQ